MFSGKTGEFLDIFVPAGSGGAGTAATLTFMPSKHHGPHSKAAN